MKEMMLISATLCLKFDENKLGEGVIADALLYNMDVIRVPFYNLLLHDKLYYAHSVLRRLKSLDSMLECLVIYFLIQELCTVYILTCMTTLA